MSPVAVRLSQEAFLLVCSLFVCCCFGMASSSKTPADLGEDPKAFEDVLVSENQSSLSLAKKALVEEITAKSWAMHKGFHITELGCNMFLFSFFVEADAVEVLQKAPWFVIDFMSPILCS